jgi:hypothetical protein
MIKGVDQHLKLPAEDLATFMSGTATQTCTSRCPRLLEAKKILVAISQDDVALGDAGRLLAVPGAIRGGRYMSDLFKIKLAPN